MSGIDMGGMEAPQLGDQFLAPAEQAAGIAPEGADFGNPAANLALGPEDRSYRADPLIGLALAGLLTLGTYVAYRLEKRDDRQRKAALEEWEEWNKLSPEEKSGRQIGQG